MGIRRFQCECDVTVNVTREGRVESSQSRQIRKNLEKIWGSEG